MNKMLWNDIIDIGFKRSLEKELNKKYIVCYDADALTEQCTKRLISLMNTILRRNGGNKSELTDLYIPAIGIDSLTCDNFSELRRCNLNIYGVKIHEMQQTPYEDLLKHFKACGGTLAPSDFDLAIGLDLSEGDLGDSFLTTPLIDLLRTDHRRVLLGSF